MTPETNRPQTAEAGGPNASVPPSPKPKLIICPYCGSRSRSLSACEACGGKFDPLSRQATQNAMGPWFIRDEQNPYRPGCSYETLVRLVGRGAVTVETVLRGPSSRQFWTLARWCPGVAHLLGICHSCQHQVEPVASACESCGASFRVGADRQAMGLGEVRFVPGRGAPSAEPDQAKPATPTAPKAEPVLHEVSESVADPRMLRLERELRIARRWRAAWAAGFTLVLLAVGGVLIGQRLNIDAGPVGRWLTSGADEPTVAQDPPEITPITTPDLASALGQAQPDDQANADPAGSAQAEVQSDPALTPTTEPAAAPDDTLPASTPSSEARLRNLDRLRRMR